jgi:two-component system response regulator FixJ
VLADLQMPGMTGIELEEALARTANPLPIVFLSGQGDLPNSVRAMRRGAEDFLTKLAPTAERIAAIRCALALDARERSARA